MPKKWPKYSAIYSRSKSKAKQRGIPFTLTEDEFAALVALSDGACMVSGIPFDEDYMEGHCRPFKASLDRINSRKGYTAQNVRLVANAVNFALNDYGDKVFERIAKGLLAKEIEAMQAEIEMLRARLVEHGIEAEDQLPGCTSHRKDGRWEHSIYFEGKRRYFYGQTPEIARTRARIAWQRHKGCRSHLGVIP